MANRKYWFQPHRGTDSLISYWLLLPLGCSGAEICTSTRWISPGGYPARWIFGENSFLQKKTDICLIFGFEADIHRMDLQISVPAVSAASAVYGEIQPAARWVFVKYNPAQIQNWSSRHLLYFTDTETYKNKAGKTPETDRNLLSFQVRSAFPLLVVRSRDGEAYFFVSAHPLKFCSLAYDARTLFSHVLSSCLRPTGFPITAPLLK